jgi:DNA topoisomerase-3
MAKTLVIAEKPSVGKDVTRVLPGPFKKHEGYLEGPEHLVSWAVGHLVQLAEPEQYDAKFKKWRMADLPIVPPRFKLVTRDERSKKQLSVVTKLLKDPEVEQVINACDAGREGELIFAYLYEKAGAKKPVQRLWLSSMTSDAMRDALANLRDGADFAHLEEAGPLALGGGLDRRHERHPRGDDPPALVVRRRGVARAGADADPGDHRPPRGGDPRVRPRAYWLVDATFAARASAYEGPVHRGPTRGCLGPSRRPPSSSGARRAGSITKLDKTRRTEKAPLLYASPRSSATRTPASRFSARRTLAAAQRLYEEHKALTYPRTSSRFLSGDMVGELKPIAAAVGRFPEYAKASAYVTGLDTLPLGRVINDAKVTDHHAIIPTNGTHDRDRFSDDDRRIYDLAVRRYLAIFHPDAVFENTRVETTVAEHVFRTRGKVLVVAGWRGVYGEGADADRTDDSDEGATSSCRSWRRARTSRRAPSRRSRRSPSRPAATRTRRCSARWRPRASSSTTTRRARP